jgi:hypothetical protein
MSRRLDEDGALKVFNIKKESHNLSRETEERKGTDRINK